MESGLYGCDTAMYCTFMYSGISAHYSWQRKYWRYFVVLPRYSLLFSVRINKSDLFPGISLASVYLTLKMGFIWVTSSFLVPCIDNLHAFFAVTEQCVGLVCRFYVRNWIICGRNARHCNEIRSTTAHVVSSKWYYAVPQIGKCLRSTSIRHRSNTFAFDRIDVLYISTRVALLSGMLCVRAWRCRVVRSSVSRWRGHCVPNVTCTSWMTRCPLWTLMWLGISSKLLLDPVACWAKRYMFVYWILCLHDYITNTTEQSHKRRWMSRYLFIIVMARTYSSCYLNGHWEIWMKLLDPFSAEFSDWLRCLMWDYPQKDEWHWILKLNDDNFTLVPGMAWCCQAKKPLLTQTYVGI